MPRCAHRTLPALEIEIFSCENEFAASLSLNRHQTHQDLGEKTKNDSLNSGVLATENLREKTKPGSININTYRKTVPTVYVQWGEMTELLRDAIRITLSWGNNVILLCDFVVDMEAFPLHGNATFRVSPIDFRGCKKFTQVFHSFIQANKTIFSGYDELGELRSKIRYRVLLNFMKKEQIDSVIYLGSDVGLLAPINTIFNSSQYEGCDAVITFGLVSGRVVKIHNEKLDAYWAGT